MQLWNLILEGRLMDFYKEAGMVSGNSYYPTDQGAAYLFPLYLVFAIWNFPTWLIDRFFISGFDNSIPAMIWMKLMLIPFVIVSAKYVYRIVSKITEDKKRGEIAAFLFASSLILLYSTALIGQYDIISVSLVTAGIYYWTCEDYRAFKICFALAVVFKYFALLYFSPLLLFKEKRVPRILLSAVEVVLPSLFFIVIFTKPEEQSSNVNNLLFVFLKGITINNFVTIPIFPLTCLAACLAAFMYKEDAENVELAAVYTLLVIMGSFCVVINPLPYWCILAVPAFILATVSSNKPNIVLAMETIIGILITIKNYILYYWCFGTRTLKAMGVLDIIMGNKAGAADIDYSAFKFLFGNSYVNWVISGALLFMFAWMLWETFPAAGKNGPECPINMKIVYARSIVNCAVVLLPMAASIVNMRG